MARRWLARRAGIPAVVEGLQVGPKGAESLVQGGAVCPHLLVQLRLSIEQELLSVEGQEDEHTEELRHPTFELTSRCIP